MTRWPRIVCFVLVVFLPNVAAWADDSESIRNVATNSIGMKLALIPAGEFKMGSLQTVISLDGAYAGSSISSDKDEHRIHRVRITQPFYLGVYEVTCQEFRTVTGRIPTPVAFTRARTKDDMRRPLTYTTWYDAVHFCNLLSEREGWSPSIGYLVPKSTRCPMTFIRQMSSFWAARDIGCQRRQNGVRLPAPEARQYGISEIPLIAWPNTLGIAVIRGTGFIQWVKRRQMPGGFTTCTEGAWEWCNDRYSKDYYRLSALSDPKGPESGTAFVLRGGSYQSGLINIRSSNRDHQSRAKASTHGFRVARTP